MQAISAILNTHNIHLDRRALLIAPALISLGIAKVTADVFAKACLGDTSTVKQVLDVIPSILPAVITNPVYNAANNGCSNNAANLIALALVSVASVAHTAYITKNAFAKGKKSAITVKPKSPLSADAVTPIKKRSEVKGSSSTSPVLSPSLLSSLFGVSNEPPQDTSNDSAKATDEVTPKRKTGRSPAKTPTLSRTPSTHSARLRTPRTPRTPKNP